MFRQAVSRGICRAQTLARPRLRKLSTTRETLGGREVRYKVSPQEQFEKQQQEMFGNTFVFRMVEKIPVKNSHLRHIIAAFVVMGILVSPKLISAKAKQGMGYLDMEAPDEIHQHRESQVRKQMGKDE